MIRSFLRQKQSVSYPSQRRQKEPLGASFSFYPNTETVTTRWTRHWKSAFAIILLNQDLNITTVAQKVHVRLHLSGFLPDSNGCHYDYSI